MTNTDTVHLADQEMFATRLFDAPPQRVFALWKDPAHLTRWWGPRGFSTTTHTMDFRPGGEWRFTMHGPDGRDYPNHIRYREIVEPQRITYAHTGEAGTEPIRFEVTVTFEAVDDRTRITMRMRFGSNAERDFTIREYGADQGLADTLDRLGACAVEPAAPSQA